ncbi:hypothetical protein C2W62_30190 [Candidatus Entotheonella serta]|nr:hypothetical protein C2W62_30190 [Candidatus Entotheonella serta]
MAFSPQRKDPKWGSVPPAGARTSVEDDNLYTLLLQRAYESSGRLFFDLRRLWPLSAGCAEAAKAYHVVVYFLFDNVEDMNRSCGQLETNLAVDAEVHATFPREDGRLGTLAFLFTSSSPLVGPMTYGEVQRAVEHYLGWCDSPQNTVPAWTRARRVTVELVPREEVQEWVDARRRLFLGSANTGVWRGFNFHCVMPCRGDKVQS